MSARACRSLTVAVLAVTALVADSVFAVPPGREKSVGQLTKTSRASYRIVQGDKEIGSESYQQRVYDNNTVVFAAEDSLGFSPGMGMSSKAELTLDEESHFPRTLHVEKRIAQAGTSFEHRIDVEMFANVAVVSSELRGVRESRRVVVPTGVAIQDMGTVFYWYQVLFWYDRSAGGRQRFQWLDPSSVKVESGEIYVAGEESLTVLGKKAKVAVFKVERERTGPATLYVDEQGTIVRCEQNMWVYDLVEKSQS